MNHADILKQIAENSEIAKLATIEGHFEAESSKKLFVFIPQIHHGSDKKHQKDINKFQEKTFKILELLSEFKIDLLGVEDITEEDNEEMSAEELIEKTEGTESDELTTWHYEKKHPKHYKTLSIDTPNLFGMRKGMLFANHVLFGKEKALEKEWHAAKAHLEEQTTSLSSEQKEQNLQAILQQKEANPELQLESFIFDYFNHVFPGFNKRLIDLHIATYLIKYVERYDNETDQGEKDKTHEMILQASDAFNKKAIGMFHEIAESLDAFTKKYLELAGQTYKLAQQTCKHTNWIFEALRSQKAIETAETVLDRESDDSMIIVFGAAHITEMEKTASEKNISWITLKPKSELWQYFA